MLAALHGADRIELCCALQMGGLTPSQGLLASVRAAEPALAIQALIRPRPGDYVYDDAAVALMVAEIKGVRDAGATGIVIGALNAADQIDYGVTEELIKAADGLHITFHRAIDHLSQADAVAAVPQLAELGVQRILTSGGCARAGDGLAQLAAMNVAAAGRLDIMAGGGVEVEDFDAFHAAGLSDVHLSAKRLVEHIRPAPMTTAAQAEDSSYFATDEAVVLRAAHAVGALLQ